MLIINKDKLKCPTCQGAMEPSVTISGGESQFWMQCSKRNCPTYVDTYIPASHQALMHKDPARYILAAGGYGTGKTLFNLKDKEKHMLITEYGRTLFGAPTFPQLNSTLKKDFENDFPADFVKKISKQDNEITLINNHELLYRSFDDQHKLRSLNLSSFSILEGSGAKYSVFNQLQNRLRNTAAAVLAKDEHGDIIYEENGEGELIPKTLADWRKGVTETNPDPGWVKTEHLERSGKVYMWGEALKREKYNFSEINPNMSTHIVPTNANPYLPPDFEKEQSVGKPDWWVKRYFKGSFSYAEGLVYPRWMETLVDPFEIPKNWKRIIAMDYGINDNTHFLFGALDNKNKVCYIYDELVISDANVRTISELYKKKLFSIPSGALFSTPVMDQRSRDKRQSLDVKKTLGDLFEDENLIFDPAQMDLNSRILRTNTLIELGQLKIFNTCHGVIKEIQKYKFPEKDLDKPHKDTSKPEDKNNHGVNALEFLVMELPPNLEKYDLTVYNRSGKRIRAMYGKQLKNKKDYSRGLDPFKDTTIKRSDDFHYGGDIDADSNIDNVDHLFDSYYDEFDL